MREAASDVLHGIWQGFGGDQQMNVVGHHDEGVESVEAFAAIVLQCVDEKPGGGWVTENRSALCGDGCDEERA